MYRSDNSGRKWSAVGDGTFGTGRNLTADAVNLRLAIGPKSALWAAVAGPVADARAARRHPRPRRLEAEPRQDTDVPPGILGFTSGHGTAGTKVTVKGRWEDPDRVRLDRVTGRISFGDRTGTHALTLRPDGRFAATHTYTAAGRKAVKVTLTDVPGAETTRTVTETIGA